MLQAERARGLQELQQWAIYVLREKANAEQLQEAWAPEDAEIFGRMRAAYAAEWTGPDLEQIGAPKAHDQK